MADCRDSGTRANPLLLLSKALQLIFFNRFPFEIPVFWKGSKRDISQSPGVKKVDTLFFLKWFESTSCEPTVSHEPKKIGDRLNRHQQKKWKNSEFFSEKERKKIPSWKKEITNHSLIFGVTVWSLRFVVKTEEIVDSLATFDMRHLFFGRLNKRSEVFLSHSLLRQLREASLVLSCFFECFFSRLRKNSRIFSPSVFVGVWSGVLPTQKFYPIFCLENESMSFCP